MKLLKIGFIAHVICAVSGAIVGSIITYLVMDVFWYGYIESTCLNSVYVSEAKNIKQQLKYISLLQENKTEDVYSNMQLEISASILALSSMMDAYTESDKKLYDSTRKIIIEATNEADAYNIAHGLPSISSDADKIRKLARQ